MQLAVTYLCEQHARQRFAQSIATTAYILVALQLEERDLVNIHGEAYIDCQCEVSILIPVL